MTRIALNALLLAGGEGYRSAGIHRYIEQLLRHLPAAAADPLQEAGIRVRRAGWATDRPIRRIAWEQFVLSREAERSHTQLLHALAYVVPVLSRLPSTVTVYDLSFYRTPERFRWLNRWYLRTFTRRSCRRARRVIAISESTRRDVIDVFGVSGERVDVAWPGVGPQFRRLP